MVVDGGVPLLDVDVPLLVVVVEGTSTLKLCVPPDSRLSELPETVWPFSVASST